MKNIFRSSALQDYFEREAKDNKIDHSLRASQAPDGNWTFYIHPTGKDGTTEDFLVMQTLNKKSISGEFDTNESE